VGSLESRLDEPPHTALPRVRASWTALLGTAVVLFSSGCMSLSTNTSLLSDSSHLGTPYSGTRGDLHTLVCFGRDASRDASGLFFAPVMLVPLIDLPLSFALDTLLLPLDVPLEADRPAQRVGEGGCRLIGM
jgi:uncharacterized protein YceK